jgi:hypothetical protein
MKCDEMVSLYNLTEINISDILLMGFMIEIEHLIFEIEGIMNESSMIEILKEIEH